MMTLISYKLRCTSIFMLCFISFFLGAHSDCGPPPSIVNTKQVQETSGTSGQTVVYTCDRDTGYYEIPNKSRTITCQDDGTWTNLDEFCTRACGVPERLEFALPVDGALDVNIFIPGHNVSYNCRNGYKRVFGLKPLITCLENYTWSNPGKFCEPRLCGFPGDIENGDMKAEQFTFGSRVTYYCHEGYSMKSSRNYRDCQADGQWSNAVPICEVVVCAAPGKPTNGAYYPEKDEYNYMDSVTFSCQKPLELDGISSISCTAKGEWSDNIPTCKAVNCIDPVVTNSKRQSGFVGPYRLNSAIVFECNTGYFLNGSSSITCNINSQWEPEVPKCLSVCSDPPDISFALLEEGFSKPQQYFDGVTVTYRCKGGYERNDKKNSVTCSNKAWTSYEQFCSRISCGNPGTILNGDVSFQDTLFGSIAKYTCHKGYVTNTTRNYRECQANRMWTMAIACTVSCLDPGISKAKLLVKPRTTTERTYMQGDVIEIECEDEYILKVNGTNAVKLTDVTCNREGQWEPSLPECIPKHEPNVGMIIGIVLGVLFVVGAIVFFSKYLKRQKERGKPQPDNLNVQYTHCNT